MGITCGNHLGPVQVKHTTIAAVRACHLAEVKACGWLIADGRDEDGMMILVQCVGLAWATDQGWTCEFGHADATAQPPGCEGGDYAAYIAETDLLSRCGINAVAATSGE
jgi:hypothetical protein